MGDTMDLPGEVHLRSPARDKTGKKINPVGSDGQPKRCVSCDSIRHMLAECPDSWENMAANLATKLDEEEAMICDVILYTGGDQVEIVRLGIEARNRMILDSACTSNVTGNVWLEMYLCTLSSEERNNVRERPGEKSFRFGGGKVLKSIREVELPCTIAETLTVIYTSVVESGIPLLASLSWMKEAGIMMDYVNDRAKIFGKWIDLDFTSAGHYCISISEDVISVNKGDQSAGEECMLLTLSQKNNPDEKRKILLKLHRQYGHKDTSIIERLLKEAECWRDEYRDILNKIIEGCKTCKIFTKTPPRPVVSLRPSSNFGEVLTIDLKDWRGAYIMHMIDAFTRFTQSCVLKKKEPNYVVENVLRHWISIFGTPGKIWTDCGGEFSNREIEDMSNNLGIEIKTTAAYAPWMNGINERNHCVTDRIVEKMLVDQPKLSLDIALCWANRAKNSLQMQNGFSSYQLVLGANPKLPNVVHDKLPALEGITTSESVFKHMQC